MSSRCFDLDLARAVGMTVQISDTTLTTRAIRPTALGHALLSYLLGLVCFCGISR